MIAAQFELVKCRRELLSSPFRVTVHGAKGPVILLSLPSSPSFQDHETPATTAGAITAQRRGSTSPTERQIEAGFILAAERPLRSSLKEEMDDWLSQTDGV